MIDGDQGLTADEAELDAEQAKMRVRPSQVYSYLVILLAGLLIVYALYSILGYDDASALRAQSRQSKHLFLTIDKERIDGRFKQLAPKRIYLWTTIFGSYSRPSLADCPGLENRCIFDHGEVARVGAADAVLFHVRDMEGFGLPPEASRRPEQRYVFMTMESPENTFVTETVKAKLPKDYFNWTMTPLFSSDVIFKYGGFWLNAKEAELRGYKMESYAVDESKLSAKIPAIFALISNCHTQSKREDALEKLNEYFNVTIAGACAKTDKLKNLCPKGKSCDTEINKYAFFFAGENTACMDYVSEKYWDRYKLPTVLVVLRRADYEHLNLPTRSIIALDDFKSPKEMGEFLQKLVKDKTAYAEYFSWRRGGWTIAPWNAEGFRNGYCKLCERLWEPQQQPTTVDDVQVWYRAESACDDGSFVREWVNNATK